MKRGAAKTLKTISTLLTSRKAFLILPSLLGLALPCGAQPPMLQPWGLEMDPLFQSSMPVNGEILSESRGGFLGPGNIRIDIGFEKILMIDGVLQAQTRLTLNELLSGHPNAVDILQNGRTLELPGLRAMTGWNGTLHTVIQNELDHRMIQSIQVLDIELSGTGSLQTGPLRRLMDLQTIQTLMR